MRTRILLICAMVLGFPGLAPARPLTYTVTGYGGLSQPVAGFSDAPFWWVDTTGNVSADALAALGFQPFVGDTGWGDAARGSLLLSDPFTLGDLDSLTVTISAVTTTQWPLYDFEFALLLQDSSFYAILANVRPDGFNHDGDLPYPPEMGYRPPSPGVTAASITGGLLPLTLGGVEYGQPKRPPDCVDRCLTQVTSSISPGAGTYELLFGAYDRAFSGRFPTALAVNSVDVSTVPEPSTLLLLGSGLAGLCGVAWRRNRKG